MEKYSRWLIFLVLAITFIAFFPSLQADFTNWDDEAHVFLNPQVVHLNAENFKAIFNSTINRTYIPLTTLTFALEKYFFGFNPFVFHLNNLLLHLGIVYLVFVLALQWGLRIEAAALGALLFGIHPTHVESVAWITERKDVLYAFFYLLAVYHYGRFLETRRKGFYYVTILEGVLSVLAKPMALSLPLILFLCDWRHGRRFSWRVILEKIPHALTIFPIALITYVLYARPPLLSLGKSALIWLWCLAFYIHKFLFPFHLSPVYVLPEPTALTNPTYAAALVTVLMLAAALIVSRLHRLGLFAFLYFFLSIFFLLRFDGLETQTVADRFLYLPSLGFCLLFGSLSYQAWKKLKKKGIWSLRLGFVSLACIYILLLSKTIVQNYVWKDSYRLWVDVIRQVPRWPVAYYNRGKFYEYYRQTDSAIADYTKAIEIKGDFAEAYYNRGTLYYFKGEYDSARYDLQKAVEFNKQLWGAYNNLGNLYYNQGQYDLAVENYSKVLQVNPDDFAAFCNRGLAYQFKGDIKSAMADFNKALFINLKAVPAYANRGNLYSELKEYDSAIADYTRVLELDPKMTVMYYNRAMVYEAKGEYAKALEDARSSSLIHLPGIEEYIIKLKGLAKGN